MKQIIIDFFKKIAKLIDLKSLITMALVGALIWGFVVGKIEPKDFLVYVGIVITFYFAKKDKNEEDKKSNDEPVG